MPEPTTNKPQPKLITLRFDENNAACVSASIVLAAHLATDKRAMLYFLSNPGSDLSGAFTAFMWALTGYETKADLKANFNQAVSNIKPKLTRLLELSIVMEKHFVTDPNEMILAEALLAELRSIPRG